MTEPLTSLSEVVYIARCPEHGLHGERESCFVCHGPVEQVEVVPLSRLEAAEGERDRLRPIVAHVAGFVAPELGRDYAQVHREVIYAARAALSTGDRQKDDSHVRAAEATQPAQARQDSEGGAS